jgi:hypothetical protein
VAPRLGHSISGTKKDEESRIEDGCELTFRPECRPNKDRIMKGPWVISEAKESDKQRLKNESKLWPEEKKAVLFGRQALWAN